MKKLTIVDPKNRLPQIYRGASIITPNLHEFNSLSPSNNESMIERARTMIRNCVFGGVVITRSAEGMSCITLNEFVHYSAAAHEVYDVSGAGDTVVATLACAIASGMPLFDAARLANIAAGIVVGKRGTATISVNELMKAL